MEFFKRKDTLEHVLAREKHISDTVNTGRLFGNGYASNIVNATGTVLLSNFISVIQLLINYFIPVIAKISLVMC